MLPGCVLISGGVNNGVTYTNNASEREMFEMLASQGGGMIMAPRGLDNTRTTSSACV